MYDDTLPLEIHGKPDLSAWKRSVAEAPEVGAFWAGAVGYFAYDIVRLFERLPNPPRRGVEAPDAIVMFPRTVVIIDNLRSQARVVCGVEVAAGANAAARRAAYDAGLADVSRTTSLIGSFGRFSDGFAARMALSFQALISPR